MLLDVACYKLQLHANCTRVLRDWRPEPLSCFSLHCFSCQIIYQQCQRNEPCKRFAQVLNLSNTCCSNPNISVVRVIAQLCLIRCVYYTCGPTAFSRRFSFTPNKADWRGFQRALGCLLFTAVLIDVFPAVVVVTGGRGCREATGRGLRETGPSSANPICHSHLVLLLGRKGLFVK